MSSNGSEPRPAGHPGPVDVRAEHGAAGRRRILLVATASFPLEQLEATLRTYAALDAEVRIVAPASNISRLDWLTNDEDGARAEAAERAEEVAQRIPATIEGIEIGDTDPLLAVEDALRVFRADELIVLRGPEDDEAWEEFENAPNRDRFDVPFTQVVVEPRSGRRSER